MKQYLVTFKYFWRGIYLNKTTGIDLEIQPTAQETVNKILETISPSVQTDNILITGLFPIN